MVFIFFILLKIIFDQYYLVFGSLKLLFMRFLKLNSEL